MFSFALLLISFLGFPTVAQTTTLSPSETIERMIAPSQRQRFRIKLEAGQFCRVRATQQAGVDLILTLSSPTRSNVAKVGGYKGYLKLTGLFPIQATLGDITLSFVSDRAGIYEIEVDARDTQISGSYQIKMVDLRWATAEDSRGVDAERAVDRGERLRFAARSKSELELAIKQYEQALDIFRNINDQKSEADTLVALALTYEVLQDSEKAIELLNDALMLCKRQNDLPGASVVLRHLAGTHTGQLKLEKALAEAEEALAIWQLLGDKLNQARAFYSQLGVRVKMVDNSQARWQLLELFKQNVAMFHEQGSVSEEAYLLTELASYYANLGESQQALDTFRQALSLVQPIGYKRYSIVPLLRIGEIFYEDGDFQAAFDFYGEAFAKSRNTDSYNEAYALYNLGVASLALNDKRALGYFTSALAIWEGNRNGEAYTLSGLGRFYSSQNEISKALDYYNRALPIMRDTGDIFGVGIILSDIGSAYAAMGDRTRANNYYERALEAHRKTNDRRDEARTLIRLGELHEASSDFDKALTHYGSALELARTIGNKSSQANAYYFLARAERAKGNLERAELNIKETLRIIEQLRAGILGQELRASYFASVQLYYEFYIDVLMSLHEQEPERGFDRLALEASEDSKARTLLELLIESRADIRRGVDPDLLQRERSLRQRLDAAALRQVKLKTEVHDAVEAKKLENEIEQLIEEFKIVEARIRAASPNYADITQPGPVSVSQLQSILDENTVLLEYSLGQNRSFLWLVTRKDVKVFVLPKRGEIEKVSRELYEAVATPPTRKMTVATKSSANFFVAANQLSQMVLKPVLPLIDGKRLIVVVDGALQYIPFASLPVSTSDYVPVIRNHEVVNLPSAATLLILRRRLKTRAMAAKAVAILADPVFSSSDFRVKPVAREKKRIEHTQSSNSRMQRALVETGFNEHPSEIPRLPFSRYEADGIARLAPREQSLKLLDFNASRAALMNPELAQYRTLHIATHGLLNSQHPELSGLLFSLVDQRGRPQNGFLQLHEIYNLDLAADLVVLSACQTALGREIRGEGLIGLTRGFMYAGANRVLATLWKVDDEATAEMMRLFYAAMIQDKQSPSAALRTAQLEMQRRKQWIAPFYWSGFTLQGEWK
jgi:CHAT domain-containing protein/tetratricopeptide (TPR) repeat protein